LHKYGPPEGSDKLNVSDTIELLIEALQAIGIADKKLGSTDVSVGRVS
jgi:hypothetical protein